MQSLYTRKDSKEIACLCERKRTEHTKRLSRSSQYHPHFSKSEHHPTQVNIPTKKKIRSTYTTVASSNPLLLHPLNDGIFPGKLMDAILIKLTPHFSSAGGKIEYIRYQSGAMVRTKSFQTIALPRRVKILVQEIRRKWPKNEHNHGGGNFDDCEGYGTRKKKC